MLDGSDGTTRVGRKEVLLDVMAYVHPKPVGDGALVEAICQQTTDCIGSFGREGEACTVGLTEEDAEDFVEGAGLNGQTIALGEIALQGGLELQQPVEILLGATEDDGVISAGAVGENLFQDILPTRLHQRPDVSEGINPVFQDGEFQIEGVVIGHLFAEQLIEIVVGIGP